MLNKLAETLNKIEDNKKSMLKLDQSTKQLISHLDTILDEIKTAHNKSINSPTSKTNKK